MSGPEGGKVDGSGDSLRRPEFKTLFFFCSFCRLCEKLRLYLRPG